MNIDKDNKIIIGKIIQYGGFIPVCLTLKKCLINAPIIKIIGMINQEYFVA
jgi:hypothetical protein